MAAKSYIVVGAYATVTTLVDGKPTVVGRYEGNPVPADVSQDQIDHLLSRGLIAEAPSGSPPPAPSTGSVAEQGAPNLVDDDDDKGKTDSPSRPAVGKPGQPGKPGGRAG
jgi:hypothetical protein